MGFSNGEIRNLKPSKDKKSVTELKKIYEPQKDKKVEKIDLLLDKYLILYCEGNEGKKHIEILKL